MMTVSLPAEMEELVNAKIQSGQFRSAGEVVREGLRLLEEQDTLRRIKLEHLRREIAVGLEAAERGEVAPLDIEATIAEAKSRLSAQAHLDALLQEGLDSGPSMPMTAQDWDDIRAAVSNLSLVP